MEEETSIKDIESLDCSITDLDFYDGLREIIVNLENVEKNFNTFAMNDRTIYYQGQKEMLQTIIKYLKKCDR